MRKWVESDTFLQGMFSFSLLVTHSSSFSVAETKLNGKIRNPIAFYHEIFVIEGAGYTLSSSYANLSARTQPLLKETSMAVSSGFLGLGKKGSIQLGASLRTLRIQANNQEPGVWKSGDTAFIGIDIKNESPKKVHSLITLFPNSFLYRSSTLKSH
jgi:hypothetical protein